MEEQKLVFSSVEPILVNVDDFTSNGYTVMSKKTAQIVAKMVRRGSSFEKLYKPPLVGVKTGYNTAYIMSDSIDYVHPWVFGRDIEKYCNPQPSKSIIYPYDEGELVKESDLPTRVLANLAAHKEQLSRRAVIKEGLPNGTKKWYEYQQVNHGIKLNDEVIVYPNVSLGSNFTISKGAIIDITAFVIPSSDKWLLGILNSRLAEFFIELYTIKRRGGYSEFKKQYVTRLPIIETDEKSNITSLTTQILQKKSQSPTADTSALEAEIDVLVYKLYGLTHGEVLVVDPEFGLTEAEYGAVEV